MREFSIPLDSPTVSVFYFSTQIFIFPILYADHTYFILLLEIP